MNRQNWILLVVLSIIWGGSFYFVEKALFYFSFEQVVFFRVFFAALFILLILWVKKIKILFDARLWAMFFVMGSLNNVVPFLALTYAQESISASLASLFNATTPIFTAVFAYFLTNDEKVTSLKTVGMAIGFVGMIMLLSSNGFGSFELSGMLAILGAVSYAIAGIFGKKLRGYNPLLNVFGMLTSSSIIMYGFFFSSIHSVQIKELYQLYDIFLLAVVSTSLAYIIYFKLLFSVGAVRLLLVTYLIPISASVLGVFLLNEEFTLPMLIGSVFIFLSLYFVNKKTNK